MLVALLYLYYVTGTFAIESMQSAPLSLLEQQLIFLAFLMAFAVKVPMWPVHTMWALFAGVGCPCGGTNWRICGFGCYHVEDGRVWFLTF